VSNKNSFNFSDFKRILINFACFNLPVFILTFLTARYQGLSLEDSGLTACITFFTALVDVVRKFSEGEKPE
jgi:hypothetical protein